jgi:hypothetical protein
VREVDTFAKKGLFNKYTATFIEVSLCTVDFFLGLYAFCHAAFYTSLLEMDAGLNKGRVCNSTSISVFSSDCRLEWRPRNVLEGLLNHSSVFGGRLEICFSCCTDDRVTTSE